MKEQTIAKRIGETGCYFLCIMYLADKITDSHFDIIEAYKKYMSMNYLGEDCFVMNPGEILSDLTGRNMRFDKAGILAVVPDDAHIIGRWSLQATMRTDGHFVVMRGNEVAYDPIGESNTVKNGKLESYRIFQEVKK
jgi:hypothetical protein